MVSVSNYYKTYYKECNETFLYIPHGISPDEFIIDENVYQEIKNEHGSGFILFIGTINIDVDLDLIRQLSEELKQYKLLIIGPAFVVGNDKVLFDKICNLPNVHYLKSIHSIFLKYYVALSKVGIVPYKRKRTENIHRTPLKIMNYLAGNKPIVTTINYELSELNEKFIFNANSNKEFIDVTKNILEGKIIIDESELIVFKEKVAYPNLINAILDSI